MLPIVIAFAFVGSCFAAQEKAIFQLPTIIPPFYTPLPTLLRSVDVESLACTITISITINCNIKRDGDQHFINFLGLDVPLGYPLAVSKRADEEDISGTITVEFGRAIFDCGFTGINPTLNPICILR